MKKLTFKNIFYIFVCEKDIFERDEHRIGVLGDKVAVEVLITLDPVEFTVECCWSGDSRLEDCEFDCLTG